jgi:hypothetical protein
LPDTASTVDVLLQLTNTGVDHDQPARDIVLADYARLRGLAEQVHSVKEAVELEPVLEFTSPAPPHPAGRSGDAG